MILFIFIALSSSKTYQLDFSERLKPDRGIQILIDNDDAIPDIKEEIQAGCLLDYKKVALRTWCGEILSETVGCSYFTGKYTINYTSNFTHCNLPSSLNCSIAIVKRNICKQSIYNWPYLLLFSVLAAALITSGVIVIKFCFDNKRKRYELIHDPLEFSE